MNKTLVLFYQAWKQRYLRRVPGTVLPQEYLFYTYDQPTENHAVTCSEAMGYGMFIFPMMSFFDQDAKEHFDALYRYIVRFPSFFNPNLMAWQQIKTADHRIVNSNDETSSATDGDMDIAYGLLLANRLWGNEDPSSNYLLHALLRINALKISCVQPGTSLLLLGDWVLGMNNSPFNDVTRSSDFMVYLIKSFLQADPKSKNAWTQVLLRIQSIIDHQITRESKRNGLMPDFFVRVGDHYIAPRRKVLESVHDGDYYYNSCRTPWRYAMDPILNNTPPTKQLHTLNTWVIQHTGENPATIMSGYYLANGIPGTAFGAPGQLSYIAPFLVCALAEPENNNWKLALWDYITKTPITAGSFYDNTLKLIALIIATGHWVRPSDFPA